MGGDVHITRHITMYVWCPRGCFKLNDSIAWGMFNLGRTIVDVELFGWCRSPHTHVTGMYDVEAITFGAIVYTTQDCTMYTSRTEASEVPTIVGVCIEEDTSLCIGPGALKFENIDICRDPRVYVYICGGWVCTETYEALVREA